MKKVSVDVIIPTYKPGAEFEKLLKALQVQTISPGRIIIMNTEEEFWESKWISQVEQGEVYHIKKEVFDHGGTRDMAAGMSDADILLFMTQDAIPQDEYLIERLTAAFEEEGVKAAYARQLPKPDCKVTEQYARAFNYPEKSQIKSKEDLSRLGIKTYFCSNVCAAYDRKCYADSGGFPRHTIFNEDMIYAGCLIQAGYKIAYVSEAIVIHSHNYRNGEQFKRNFDLAVSQTDFPEIFASIKSEIEGVRFVLKSIRYLISIHKPWLMFGLVITSGCKYMGYWLGKRYKKLSPGLILACTMNRAYWTFEK